MTRIVVSWNPSSIGSLITKELLRRGISTHLYAVSSLLTDNDYVQEVSGYRSVRRRGWSRRLLTAAEFRLKRGIRNYDLELTNVAGEASQLGIKATSNVPYYHGVELTAGYVKPERGFYATPNMQRYMPNSSVLLPRCVNLDLFWKRIPRRRERDEKLRIGHFWRRGSITADFAFRYFKGSDLLEEALGILGNRGIDVEYVDRLVPRTEMASTLRNLDVLADQFYMGIYGIPALEALLLGVPVVGHYRKEFCENLAVYELLTKVERTPESIAEGILSASENPLDSSGREIAEFHSPRHSVDVFLDAVKRWKFI